MKFTHQPGQLLVVDDNRVNRLLLSRALEQNGHRVSNAENGRIAMEMLCAQPFDVILLDIDMPEMNGFEVLEAMLENKDLRDLPVNYIKIDRSFVKEVDRSELCSAIVESIQHIAELIGAKTVAEGVETQEIAEMLHVIGVDYGQGWLFGRPGPIAALAVPETT